MNSNIENETPETENTVINEVENVEIDLISQPSPEYLQKKLYFLLEQLKVMHAALQE